MIKRLFCSFAIFAYECPDATDRKFRWCSRPTPFASGSGPKRQADGLGFIHSCSLQAPVRRNMTCIYCSIVIFSPFETFVGRVAELNLSNATIRLTWRTPLRRIRCTSAGTCQELSRMARGSLSPAIRLLWFGARGPRRPGPAWIMPAKRAGPLEFSRSC